MVSIEVVCQGAGGGNAIGMQCRCQDAWLLPSKPYSVTPPHKALPASRHNILTLKPSILRVPILPSPSPMTAIFIAQKSAQLSGGHGQVGDWSSLLSKHTFQPLA